MKGSAACKLAIKKEEGKKRGPISAREKNGAGETAIRKRSSFLTFLPGGKGDSILTEKGEK